MHETARKRGRPRPAETIARDESIAALLWRDQTLRDLAEIERLSHSQTYHALRRLQRAGRVQTIRDGKQHYWALTATTHA